MKIVIRTVLLILAVCSVFSHYLKANPLLEKQLPYSDSINKNKALAQLELYLKNADKETVKGYDLVLGQGIGPVPQNSENYALTLFLFLLENRAWIEGDCITPALALANNYLYSIADDTVKNEIRKDMVRHFEFYKTLCAYQKENEFAYTLDKTGLIARLFWADRSSYSLGEINQAVRNANQNGKLNITIYGEFVDSIDSYKTIAGLLKKERLLSPSLKKTAEQIESYVHGKRLYLSSIENLKDFNARKMYSDADLQKALAAYNRGEYEKDYFGKRRRWDEYRWLNFQMDLFKKEGIFRGDCGDTTVVQMGFFRAAGIAPVSLQWIDPGGIAAYTHNFPGYYHPVFKRWFSVQKPVFYGQGGAILTEGRPSCFHYIRPVFHHSIYKQDFRYVTIGGYNKIIHYSFYPGELTNSVTIKNTMDTGIAEEQFEQSVLTGRTLQKGVLTDEYLSASDIADADRDGIVNILEKNIGTDPENIDTDRDGYSDYYEIEYGLNPLVFNSLPAILRPAIDGIVKNELGEPGYETDDPADDYKSASEIYDIKHLYCTIQGKNLYAGVQFHNSISSNRVKIFSFLISAKKGGSIEKYWVQRVNEHQRIYEHNGSKYEPIGTEGLDGAVLRDAEFLVPLSYFKNAELLYVQFFGSGYYDLKDQIIDDTTIALRVPLKEEIEYGTVFNLSNTKSVDDPEDDNKKSISDVLDIKKMSCADNGTFIVCRAGFFNPGPGRYYGIHTLHFRNPVTKNNYWVQFWGSGFYDNNVYLFKDGQKGENSKVDKTGIESYILNKDIMFVIPKILLGNGKNLELMYHTGGKDQGGEFQYREDSTEKLVLD